MEIQSSLNTGTALSAATNFTSESPYSYIWFVMAWNCLWMIMTILAIIASDTMLAINTLHLIRMGTIRWRDFFPELSSSSRIASVMALTSSCPVWKRSLGFFFSSFSMIFRTWVGRSGLICCKGLGSVCVIWYINEATESPPKGFWPAASW